MIPSNIQRNHIIKALRVIDSEGIPPGRESRNFLLVFEGKKYPPKYVLSLANKFANGEVLDPSRFSGGQETNNFLKNFGFNIERIHISGKRLQQPPEHAEAVPRPKAHNERCPECKETIRKLLEKIYGKVEESPKFEVGTHLEDFKDTPFYAKLKEIYQTLQSYRGFKELLKAKTLPTCDLFIPNPGFVFEYDESQHFTLPRKMTLEHYPESLKLGFDKKRWIQLCERIRARDNDKDTPHRDEQRAWYETIRDFLPAMKGLRPTVRLCMKDFEWCSLNPDNPSDVERFKGILKGNLGRWEINVIHAPNPSIGRIIIREEWDGNLEEAKNLLEEVYDEWPKGKKVRFLITCGGFIQFNWPKSITWDKIGDNKNPQKEPLNALIKEAEKCAKQILSNGLGDKLSQITDYITLGIDSYKEKISMTQSYISELHVESVFLADLKSGKFYWTGKSYPTPGQQNGLVRIADLKTHFVSLSGIGKVMILGCHDLTMFNNRNMENTGRWRRDIKREFRQLAGVEKPVIVLHHPHTTVTTGTWRNGWSTISKTLPSVQLYAGAGRFYERDRKKYDGLNDVLNATKRSTTIDFIVRKRSSEKS